MTNKNPPLVWAFNFLSRLYALEGAGILNVPSRISAVGDEALVWWRHKPSQYRVLQIVFSGDGGMEWRTAMAKSVGDLTGQWQRANLTPGAALRKLEWVYGRRREP